jgi:hypothetical protein
MTYRYQTRREDTELRERLLALSLDKPRYGYGCGCYWLAIGRRIGSASITWSNRIGIFGQPRIDIFQEDRMRWNTMLDWTCH